LKKEKENGYVRIAIVVGSHGLNGRLKLRMTTDNPDRFAKNSELILLVNGIYKTDRVKDFSYVVGKPGLLSLNGINTRNESDDLKGVEIFIKKDLAEKSRSDFDEDSFYYYDLIGCEVFIDSKSFGFVDNLMEAGSGIILVVKDFSEKSHLIPFVKEMVDTKRIKEKKIDITPIEGLIEI